MTYGRSVFKALDNYLTTLASTGRRGRRSLLTAPLGAAPSTARSSSPGGRRVPPLPPPIFALPPA